MVSSKRSLRRARRGVVRQCLGGRVRAFCHCAVDRKLAEWCQELADRVGGGGAGEQLGSCDDGVGQPVPGVVRVAPMMRRASLWTGPAPEEMPASAGRYATRHERAAGRWHKGRRMSDVSVPFKTPSGWSVSMSA